MAICCSGFSQHGACPSAWETSLGQDRARPAGLPRHPAPTAGLASSALASPSPWHQAPDIVRSLIL